MLSTDIQQIAADIHDMEAAHADLIAILNGDRIPYDLPTESEIEAKRREIRAAIVASNNRLAQLSSSCAALLKLIHYKEVAIQQAKEIIQC